MEMDLNFFGTQRCVNVLGKQMAQRGKGHILVVGTACSYTFVPGYPGYTASKFAQRGYVETIRHELRQYGVYVHLFLPGTIDTPGLKKENEIKSSLSWDIEGKSTCLTADEAAQICIKGFKEGRYQYTTETFLDLLLIPAAGNAGRFNILSDLLLAIPATLMCIVMDFLIWQKTKAFISNSKKSQ